MFVIQVVMLLFTFNCLRADEFHKSVFNLRDDQKNCKPGGYFPYKEYVSYSGSARLDNPDDGNAPPILLYLQSQEDATKTLVCIFDWSDARPEGECQWKMDVRTHIYDFRVKIPSSSAVNNMRILMTQRTDAKTYNVYIPPVIKVRPEPELILTIENQTQDILDCVFVESFNDSILVEFCVKYLKKLKISLSLENESFPSVEQDCVKRDYRFSTGGSLLILATYEDECCKFGSVSCLIKNKHNVKENNDVNETTTIPPSKESKFWMEILAPVFLGTVIPASGLFLLYRKIVSAKARKENKLKEDLEAKKDKQLAGAIFEVFTASSGTNATEEDSDSSASNANTLQSSVKGKQVYAL